MEEKINGQRQLTYFSIFLSLSLQQALISDFQIWLHTVLTKVSISGLHIYSSSFDCSLLLYIPIISLKDQSTAPPILSHWNWIHPFDLRGRVKFWKAWSIVFHFGVGDSDAVILLSLYPWQYCNFSLLSCRPHEYQVEVMTTPV